MKKKHSRGVIIVEAMIAITLVGIITVATLSITANYRKSFAKNLEKYESHLIADNALAAFQWAENAAEFNEALGISFVGATITADESGNAKIYDASYYTISSIDYDADFDTITLMGLSGNPIHTIKKVKSTGALEWLENHSVEGKDTELTEGKTHRLTEEKFDLGASYTRGDTYSSNTSFGSSWDEMDGEIYFDQDSEGVTVRIKESGGLFESDEELYWYDGKFYKKDGLQYTQYNIVESYTPSESFFSSSKTTFKWEKGAAKVADVITETSDINLLFDTVCTQIKNYFDSKTVVSNYSGSSNNRPKYTTELEKDPPTVIYRKYVYAASSSSQLGLTKVNKTENKVTYYDTEENEEGEYGEILVVRYPTSTACDTAYNDIKENTGAFREREIQSTPEHYDKTYIQKGTFRYINKDEQKSTLSFLDTSKRTVSMPETVQNTILSTLSDKITERIYQITYYETKTTTSGGGGKQEPTTQTELVTNNQLFEVVPGSTDGKYYVILDKNDDGSFDTRYDTQKFVKKTKETSSYLGSGSSTTTYEWSSDPAGTTTSGYSYNETTTTIVNEFTLSEVSGTVVSEIKKFYPSVTYGSTSYNRKTYSTSVGQVSTLYDLSSATYGYELDQYNNVYFVIKIGSNTIYKEPSKKTPEQAGFKLIAEQIIEAVFDSYRYMHKVVSYDENGEKGTDGGVRFLDGLNESIYDFPYSSDKSRASDLNSLEFVMYKGEKYYICPEMKLIAEIKNDKVERVSNSSSSKWVSSSTYKITGQETLTEPQEVRIDSEKRQITTVINGTTYYLVQNATKNTSGTSSFSRNTYGNRMQDVGTGKSRYAFTWSASGSRDTSLQNDNLWLDASNLFTDDYFVEIASGNIFTPKEPCAIYFEATSNSEKKDEFVSGMLTVYDTSTEPGNRIPIYTRNFDSWEDYHVTTLPFKSQMGVTDGEYTCELEEYTIHMVVSYVNWTFAAEVTDKSSGKIIYELEYLKG